MPFLFPHLALMPDTHLGKGATLGSVIPTKRAITPTAVGVDTGCGMAAVRTPLTAADLRARGPLVPLREAVERAVPLSAGGYNAKIVATAEPRVAELTALAERDAGVDLTRSRNWALQLGTLGSGNHFIVVTLDELDRVWVFLHSRSRGVGNKIAQHHTAVAQQLCRQWWIPLPDPDLAYLVEGTDESRTYVREMTWAQHFAALNRDEMVDRVVRQLAQHVGVDVERHETINFHHNYTARERHYGRDVGVSRTIER
jgi:tRNA-splicing ligase RtcB